MKTQNHRFEQSGDVATLEEHQKALHGLLTQFDRVCKELNIPYFLFAGTLLGAVRHKGFIPWDDDLDILIQRDAYDRFMKEASGVLNQEDFYLQAEFSEHWPMFFSKLRLNGTTCLEKYHPKDPQMHQGVYMDIFPCDNAYNSKIFRYIQFLASKVVIAKGLYAEGYETHSKAKKLMMLFCQVLPRKPFHRIVRGPKKRGRYVHCFLGASSKFSKSVFPAELFEGHIDLPFEDGAFSAPEGYDAVLKTLYGDYQQIPPPEQRKYKEHAILVDLHRSYEHYKTYRDGMKFDVYTRSIR